MRHIWRLLDELTIEPVFAKAPKQPINLVLDATYFGRRDGVMVFRAHGQNLYWYFIATETVDELMKGLDWLDRQGFCLHSVTIDGKKGYISSLRARYPHLPIQLCQFHQAQIIRRYLTLRPKTECGKHLKAIMRCLTDTPQDQFESLVTAWAEIHHDFLQEKNDQGRYKHRNLRSAHRSLLTNMPYLFTYRNHPKLHIPNTTNSCDGSFAHWKQKVLIHRGLKKHRRDKMINFLLSQTNLS